MNIKYLPVTSSPTEKRFTPSPTGIFHVRDFPIDFRYDTTPTFCYDSGNLAADWDLVQVRYHL